MDQAEIEERLHELEIQNLALMKTITDIVKTMQSEAKAVAAFGNAMKKLSDRVLQLSQCMKVGLN